MQLSVIIPCYNAASVIGEQLEALSTETWSEPWEIIVADNGSTDDSLATIERYRTRLPNLRVIMANSGRGAAFARNLAARQAQGVNLAFVDADDVIAHGWVAAIGEALRTHPFVASRFDITKLNAPWIVASRPNSQGEDVQRISYPPYLPHAGGCGLGVRRAIHESVNGFDASMPYLEDTDYCFRIQIQHQIELRLAPEAVVHIRYRSDLRAMFQQARIWAMYNVFLGRKYRPSLYTRKHHLRGWLNYSRRWRKVLLRLFRIRQQADLAIWLRQAGWLIGLLQGSLKYGHHPV